MARKTYRIDTTMHYGGPDRIVQVPTQRRGDHQPAPPTPCETYDCPNFEGCKDRQLLCHAYIAYLLLTRGAPPMTRKRLAKRARAAWCRQNPTRELFDKEMNR